MSLTNKKVSLVFGNIEGKEQVINLQLPKLLADQRIILEWFEDLKHMTELDEINTSHFGLVDYKV